MLTLTFLLSTVYSAKGSLFDEVKKFTALGAAGNDQFGFTVAVSGETIVIGSRFDDNSGGSLAGSAYIYQRNQNGTGNWGLVKMIVANDAAPFDNFGSSVAINGNTIVIGSSHDDDACIMNISCNSGSVYIFDRNMGGTDNWGEVTKIIASDHAAGDEFGISTAISGNTITVGAALNSDVGNSSGAAYIFYHDNENINNWEQIRKIRASDESENDKFGISVSISGDLLAVGAEGSDDLFNNSGAVYIYERSMGGKDNWGEVKKITASDPAEADTMGRSIEINGNTLVAGALFNSDMANIAGAAYVFERHLNGTNNWGEAKKIFASDPESSARFGIDVSISSNSILIGAFADNSTGSAYVFERDQGGSENWGEVRKINALDAGFDDFFGESVAINGDIAVVGARLDDDACPGDTSCNSGSAYAFLRGGADISIVMSDSVDPVVTGSRFIYTMTVTNSGPEDTDSVIVIDTLPPELSFVESEGCQEDPTGYPNCSLGILLKDELRSYNLTVELNSTFNGSFTFNHAVVSATVDEAHPSDNSITEETGVIDSNDIIFVNSFEPVTFLYKY